MHAFGRLRPHLTKVLAVATVGAGLLVVAPSTPAFAATTDIRINEVESNGDTRDWIELKNTGSGAVDVSGWVLMDNQPETLTVPAGTAPIQPGGYLAVDVNDPAVPGNFGLGAADSARVFLPNGTTLIDTYTWGPSHAAVTFGRCNPDGTGTFVDTVASTKGAANSCPAPGNAPTTVKINEVESVGGTPGDWIELYNTSATAVDISGLRVKDSDDTRTFAIPASTSIAGNGYYVLEEAALGFGLDGIDSARLYSSDGATLLDSYSWTTDGDPTYGRCPNGTGSFTTTQQSSKGAANICPGDIITTPWPGGADVTTVDQPGLITGNGSGLIYEGSGTSNPGTLWMARNGTGALFKLVKSGSSWVNASGDWAGGKLLHYTDGLGDPDSEGVTYASGGSSAGMYVSTERNNANSGVSRPAVLKFMPDDAGTELTAVRDWNLTADLPTVGANLGLEGIAFVPDSYLTAHGFLDQTTSAAYDPATYPDHGTGLFLVTLEANGTVYAYALNQSSDTYTRVATFASGLPAAMELHWEAETQKLWVVCDDTCQGRSATFAIDTTPGSATLGRFKATSYYDRPATMPNLNNEGFTTTPRAECLAGVKPVFWADDGDTGTFTIRQGTLGCSTPPAQTVTITSAAPTPGAVGSTYTVTATGGASGNPVVLSIDPASSAVCTISGAVVTFTASGSCTVLARQAGTDSAGPGSASQTITVSNPQTVTFTSTKPAAPVVGQTYAVTTTGGGSGNPVVLSIDAGSAAVCSLTGSTVTFTHVGTCLVRADQAGDGSNLPGSASQSIVVGKALTGTTASVTATTIKAVVTVKAPGAGTPTGDVVFLVDGAVVGTAPVTAGTATLTYTVPTGGARTIDALYQGASDFSGSAGTKVRRDPRITASVASPGAPRTSYGWYSVPVRVSFTCAPQGAALSVDCPDPVVLTLSKADQSVTRTITADDGGTATVTVSDLDIDRVAPTVKVGGVTQGRVYTGTAPRATCVGTDKLSGIATCRLVSRSTKLKVGKRVTVTATATDKAGNTAVKTVTYTVKPKKKK